MKQRFLLLLALIATLALFPTLALGDEVRPAYLELVEGPPDVYEILWKVPADLRDQLKVVFPPLCASISPTRVQISNGAVSSRWSIRCTDGLTGQTLTVAGLESVNTDVLVRLRWGNEAWLTHRLDGSSIEFQIPARGTQTSIATTYLVLGIEHILLGFDHLLFVFGLLLLVGNVRQLVATITSFTLAHSITLVLATVGFANVSQQPVEAVIALSIVFLAVEISRKQRGTEGMTSRYPWIVAFLFGLLHGFGFAGALSEIGLPAQAIPLALIFFNVGVECGQLLFVAAMLLLWRIVKKAHGNPMMTGAQTLATYSLGGLASFWLIERVLSFSL